MRCSEQTVWAWLGSTRVVTSAEAVRLASAMLPDGVEFAIGEPAQGREGLAPDPHRQAQAARRVSGNNGAHKGSHDMPTSGFRLICFETRRCLVRWFISGCRRSMRRRTVVPPCAKHCGLT